MRQLGGEVSLVTASLTGMDDVFNYGQVGNSLPSPVLSVPKQLGLEGNSVHPGESTQIVRSPRIKRVLRGTYSKGLLILKEEEFSCVNELPGEGRERSRVIVVQQSLQEPFFIAPTKSTEIDRIVAQQGGSDSALIGLLKSYAEQNKIANKLIAHLSDQLQAQDHKTELPFPSNANGGLWSRLLDVFRLCNFKRFT